VEIKDSNYYKLHEIKETTYDHELNYTGIPRPFLAYSPNGTVSSVSCIFL